MFALSRSTQLLEKEKRKEVSILRQTTLKHELIIFVFKKKKIMFLAQNIEIWKNFNTVCFKTLKI